MRFRRLEDGSLHATYNGSKDSAGFSIYEDPKKPPDCRWIGESSHPRIERIFALSKKAAKERLTKYARNVLGEEIASSDEA